MNEPATLPSQRRLGRGLSALLGGGAPAFEESDHELHSELCHISTAQLTRNPFQPRKEFDPESIGELASSVREHGILQPLLVREIDGGYQIIAGERRWQAAQKAGLVSIPCRVVDVVDKTACEFALEENLKRKDLNDLEKAQAFRDYLDQFECSIEELSKQLSMKRSTVSNMLRLLELPDPIKNALNSSRLTAGHARALLPLDEAAQLELSSRIQAERMSVRATEAVVKKLMGRAPAVEPAAEPVEANQESQVPAGEQQEGASNEEHQHHEHHNQEQHHEQHEGEHAHQEHHEGEHHHHEEQQHHDHHGEEQQHGEQHHHEGEQHHEGQHHHEGEDHPETIPMHDENSHRTHHVESLEAQLRDLLGVTVEIKLNSKDAGQIVVPFANNEEFERILGTLRRNAA